MKGARLLANVAIALGASSMFGSLSSAVSQSRLKRREAVRQEHLAREIAEHNAAVDAKKAAKRERQAARRAKGDL